MMFQTWFTWKIKWKHEKTLAELFKTTVSLKSISTFKLEDI
jgi:hypothetical protein